MQQLILLIFVVLAPLASCDVLSVSLSTGTSCDLNDIEASGGKTLDQWLSGKALASAVWLRPTSFSERPYDVVLDWGSDLTKVLTIVQEKEGWWQYGPHGSIAAEVKATVDSIEARETDKGTETTVASLYIAYKGLKAGKEASQILPRIHDAWCYITYLHEGGVLPKRKGQFVAFNDLPAKGQAKDSVWVDAVEQVMFK